MFYFIFIFNTAPPPKYELGFLKPIKTLSNRICILNQTVYVSLKNLYQMVYVYNVWRLTVNCFLSNSVFQVICKWSHFQSLQIKNPSLFSTNRRDYDNPWSIANGTRVTSEETESSKTQHSPPPSQGNPMVFDTLLHKSYRFWRSLDHCKWYTDDIWRNGVL